MNTLTPNAIKLALLVALPSTVLMTTSCSSLPKGEATKHVITQEGVPGGYTLETFKTTATVTGIDAATRKITIVSKEGKKQVLKAGPEVVNFDQIRIGDQLIVTVAEEVIVFMAQEGMPIADGAAAAVALAPKGDKPGMLVAGTAQITAKVIGIDRKSRKAMLQLPDGTTKTIKVRPDVDLSKRSVGEGVVIRCTDAVAIHVEKP